MAHKYMGNRTAGRLTKTFTMVLVGGGCLDVWVLPVTTTLTGGVAGRHAIASRSTVS